MRQFVWIFIAAIGIAAIVGDARGVDTPWYVGRLADEKEEGLLYQTTVYVCDSTDDRILTLRDVDRSGSIDAEVAGELTVSYDDTSPGPDLSVPSGLEVDASGALFLLDGGTVDAVLVLTDGNGDGDLNDAGEFSVFYDNSGDGPRLATPNTLVMASDGSLFITDDGSRARWVLRLRDLDGNGQALDPGEAVVVFDSSAPSPMPLEEPESIALDPSGGVFVGDSTHGAIFRLVDLDGNGDFLGIGESGLFFQSTAGLTFERATALVVDEGGTVYLADQQTGLVLRLEDMNGDGDAMDAGEGFAFADPAAGGPGSPRDLALLPVGSVLAADGAADTLYVLEDLNGDGDARDPGEALIWVQDGRSSLSTPSGIAFSDTFVQPPPPVLFTRGDVNSDGVLDLSDPIRILEHLYQGKPSGPCLDALDGDDTGELDLSDPIYLLSYLFQGGPEPPPPYPDRGPDPTVDTLVCEAAEP